MQVKKVLTSIALAVAAIGSAHAVVLPDFKFDNTATGLTSGPTVFGGDKMVGGYSEVISFDGAGNFAVSIRWRASSLFGNEGNDEVLGSGVSRLYALSYATGTVVQTATQALFTVTSGSIGLYYDAGLNTGFTNPAAGGGAFTLTNGGDDLLLGTGSIISPSGGELSTTGSCGQNNVAACGKFGQTSTLSLTADGLKFFVDPVPFYSVSFQAGQLNSFALSQTQTINGSLDVSFVGVPEPTSLALAGLALLGLGAARRRRG